MSPLKLIEYSLSLAAAVLIDGAAFIVLYVAFAVVRGFGQKG